MNESITSRVNRLISGSLNSFVDTVEKMAPEMVMEEAIREVNSAIAEIRVELGRVIAKKHLTHVHLNEDDREYKSLSDKISIALEAQREDLAEVAIAKQLEIEAQQLILESTLENCSQQEQELQAYLMALEEKKQGLGDELSRFVVSQQTQGSYKYKQGVTVAARINNAESTFNRLLEKQTGFDRTALLVDSSGAIQLAQLEELNNKDAIKKRLDQLQDRKE